MCHPERPEASSPDVQAQEEVVVLSSGEHMGAFFAHAPGDASRPAVLVVGDIFGARTPFYEHLAMLLAAEGFDALVPEFFFRQGPLSEQSFDAAFARKASLDEQQTLRDLSEAIDWLRNRAVFAGRRVGTLGFCLGGTLVLNLAAMRDDLGTVCYYGFPTGAPGRPTDTAAPRPLDEVDRMAGPILGFWGDRDEPVGMKNVAALANALASRGTDFEHTVYPGLEHGFLASGFDPNAEGHGLARESWTRALAFFNQKLRPSPG